jgi:hypothetical protein
LRSPAKKTYDPGEQVKVTAYDATLFNVGLVFGAGVGFSENHSRRYFYRICRGHNYGTHIAGMWWLF